MERIPDDLLVETYYNAVEKQLSTDFLLLLLHEMEKRHLTVPASM
jgi:hypothetical protein